METGIIQAIVFVAELTAFIGLLVWDRRLVKERTALVTSWEDLAKTAGEIHVVVDEVAKARAEIPHAVGEILSSFDPPHTIN